MLNFDDLPLVLVLGVFAAGSAIVWLAGAKLTGYATELSERLGLSKAFIGMLLLGGITSLPELATTATAALDDRAQLAVNNLLGGVSLQVTVLAVVDIAIGAAAFSAIVARPGVLLLGALDIVLLCAVLVAILLGEFALGGIGVGAAAVFVLFLGAAWIVNRAQGRTPWKPGETTARGDGTARDAPVRPSVQASSRRLFAQTALVGTVILAAGVLVTRSAEVIAEQTPLGESFVGVALLALATSLPELSTTLAAARLRQYELAFADIFGTNLFDLALLLVADVLYDGGPVLAEAGQFAAVAAVLGIVLTTIYLIGLIERRDRAILRMGYDSLAVLIVYASGLYLLFRIR